MKIYDCFLFFNELELLELRLMTLSGVVDYFVLVEANKSFTGNTKAFLFEKNQRQFKKYLPRIIYIKVEDAPVLDESQDVWAMENFQRNCITRGLVNAKDEDKVIISDVDEIPDPAKIIQVLDSNDPVTFSHHLFYYFVNCLNARRKWNGSVMAPFKKMVSPQILRGQKRRFNKISGGWHYSYLGGLDKIKLKLNNLSDAYMRRGQVGGDEDILRKVNSQRNLWDEKISYRLIDIDKKDFSPASIKKFITKYPNFFFKN